MIDVKDLKYYLIKRFRVTEEEATSIILSNPEEISVMLSECAVIYGVLKIFGLVE